MTIFPETDHYKGLSFFNPAHPNGNGWWDVLKMAVTTSNPMIQINGNQEFIVYGNAFQSTAGNGSCVATVQFGNFNPMIVTGVVTYCGLAGGSNNEYQINFNVEISGTPKAAILPATMTIDGVLMHPVYMQLAAPPVK